MPASGIDASFADYVRTRFVLTPLSYRPDIALYGPTPGSGLTAFLGRLGRTEAPPYWAYGWAGGAALVLYLNDNPQDVAGRSVLDFGAGSGLVGIAAAMAGATVTAYEPDPLGQLALTLNAGANGVSIAQGNATTATEVVLAGDVFYDASVAAVTLPLLEAHAARGARVIVGDPFRRDLPRTMLEQIGEYMVPDMGGGEVAAGIFTLPPANI
ncbi:50S ribosomal protein L11 methyltransferase [Devosia sp.]|uniref:class I SAM-dependent methyltransferase n=1 Tax=Devosia sp. TaxID=1871048 RepID=UPI0026070517|nr:50S ribosomal protein L11 methyltransferase [Devosia sp.]